MNSQNNGSRGNNPVGSRPRTSNIQNAPRRQTVPPRSGTGYRQSRGAPAPTPRRDGFGVLIVVLAACTVLTVALALGLFIGDRIAGAGNDTSSPSGTSGVTDPPVSGSDGTDTPGTSAPVTDPPVTDSPVTTPPVTDAPVTDNPSSGVPDGSFVLKETPDAGKAYLSRIVFMGDSTTYGMLVYADVAKSQVWCPLSGTLDFTDITTKKIAFPEESKNKSDWTEITIPEALQRAKPDILVVTLGINYSADFNGSWDAAKKEAYFKLQVKNLRDTVSSASPDTVLVFQSIYPVIDSLAANLDNSDVERRNGWLTDACREYGIPLLWSNGYMKDASGQLNSAYNTYHNDGIHLNPAGFEAVLKFVRTHAVPEN